MELAIKTASSLIAEQEIIADTAYLVLDSLLAAPPGFEFFPRFPKEEVVQFCRLAVASREQGVALPVVCPVCPDYPELGINLLGTGIGYAAGRVLSNLDTFLNFFRKRNITVNLHMLIADVEVLNPIMLGYSGETPDSFLAKIQATQAAIQAKINRMGAGEIVQVGSMAQAFAAAGFDYPGEHQRLTAAIKNSQEKKIIRVRQALLEERRRQRNFDGFTPAEEIEAVALELADYGVFGDLISGRAIILSPDAASAVPAYNFLRTGHDQKTINPTIYLKEVKEKGGGLYGYD